jgi:DNA recombination protein RmuC
MIFTYILLGIILLFIVIIFFGYIKNNKKGESDNNPDIKASFDGLTNDLIRIETILKTDFKNNREELASSAKANREELATSMKNFSETLSKGILESFGQQNNLLDTFSKKLDTLTNSNNEKLDNFTKTLEAKFTQLQESTVTNNKEARKELKDGFESFKKEIENSLNNYKDAQRENFDNFQTLQKTQSVANSEKLESLKNTIEKSIKNLQDGNEKKLEEMRKTVDEKLEKTLETRLTQSFKLVSERLETVHKGLGEMQQLATGVGDLKKVLSNVKTRGILGEVQLSNILEQILSPEQYEINIVTKKGTNNRVEFAIKIPQQGQENKVLLMPIDSKFPIEDYYSLIAAHDIGDVVAADAAGKALENAIRKSAKDIHDKYINPPDTSEIGLLFLPIEGLYAEVVRRPALMEVLQRDFQIIVTGPTTLSAILNTISFGYKTMAMEQRSGEIKKTLNAVKTEFGKFGDVLKKAQEKINKASEDIDELVGARTKKINAKLKSFEEMPVQESKLLLDIDNTEDLDA